MADNRSQESWEERERLQKALIAEQRKVIMEMHETVNKLRKQLKVGK
jgi:hypothetical protein